MDAYRSLLMHGEYPHVSLWLECDPAVIDVNIHPTKSQVKFQDSSAAFRMVQETLRDALEKAPWVSSYHTQVAPSFSAATTAFFEKSGENLSWNDHSLGTTQFKNKNFNLQDLRLLAPENDEPQIKSGYWSSLQVIGQVNLTYIVCQKNDRMVLVDQHAAHERVVFESLMQSWKNNQFEIQEYLFPLAIDLTEDKVEVLLKNETEINKLGFTIEQLGPQVIGVKSAPHLVKDSGLPGVFERMASDLISNGGSLAIEKKISDFFASMACHSVVRAGQSLSHDEMKQLLRSMDQYALSSFCPHGRPVSVDLTFNELDKLFGRIN